MTVRIGNIVGIAVLAHPASVGGAEAARPHRHLVGAVQRAESASALAAIHRFVLSSIRHVLCAGPSGAKGVLLFLQLKERGAPDGLATPVGFEPTTLGLEVRRSVQLS